VVNKNFGEGTAEDDKQNIPYTARKINPAATLNMALSSPRIAGNL
jgi:hypothetical protein